MVASRVIVLADDLIWSGRLAALVRAADAEPVAVRSAAGLSAALATTPRAVIVDLTARAYDAISAVGAANAAGAAVLAVGQHDDVDLMRRARGAGAGRVLAYRKLADDGPATIGAWLRSVGDSAPSETTGPVVAGPAR
jgi:hypothetical protein